VYGGNVKQTACVHDFLNHGTSLPSGRKLLKDIKCTLPLLSIKHTNKQEDEELLETFPDHGKKAFCA